MKARKISAIETPYEGVSEEDYQIEKRRLQLEILKIQQLIVRDGHRLAIVFEGRDAAGKGSTIKRFTENLMPNHFDIVSLGIPSKKESKFWFRRYEHEFPKPGQITFFDRSWYSRAMIEPTMGYCTESQYKYFMNKVLNWEHQQMDNGLNLVKFYLSVDKETQLYRFEDRINNPLLYWKFSENDLKAREKWEVYTRYKEQMFAKTSSARSPWVVISANVKREARLTAMLYLVRLYGNRNFVPLTGEDVTKTHTIRLGGVKFRGLTSKQHAVLQEIKVKEDIMIELDESDTND